MKSISYSNPKIQIIYEKNEIDKNLKFGWATLTLALKIKENKNLLNANEIDFTEKKK